MKITVKHYLNKRLKPKKVEREGKLQNAFPLYVQVLVKGKQAQIKSRLEYFTGLPQLSNDSVNQFYFLFGSEPRSESLYFTQKEFKLIYKNPIQELINEESVFIRYVINYQLSKTGKLNLSAISELRSELCDDFYDRKSFNEEEFIEGVTKSLFKGIPNIKRYFFLGMWDVLQNHGLPEEETDSLIFSFLKEISELKGNTNLDELRSVNDYLLLISMRYEFSRYLSETGGNDRLSEVSVYSILHSNIKLKWYDFLLVKLPDDRRKRIEFYRASIKRLYEYEAEIFAMFDN